ncbi:MAG: hypothetical protein M3Y72_14875, partial [Acidobacteriota bacterium]|nr:hypothetical protein [Acidobacteriota bacterium]
MLLRPKALLPIAQRARTFAVLTAVIALMPSLSNCQYTAVTNVTSTPIPGVGHNYLQDLSEIINPANGSVSIRIAVPMPKERGVNFPIYAYTYDTNGRFLPGFKVSYTDCSHSIGNDAGQENCVLSVFGPLLQLPEVAAGPYAYPGPNSVISQQYSYRYVESWRADEIYGCDFESGYLYVDPF